MQAVLLFPPTRRTEKGFGAGGGLERGRYAAGGLCASLGILMATRSDTRKGNVKSGAILSGFLVGRVRVEFVNDSGNELGRVSKRHWKQLKVWKPIGHLSLPRWPVASICNTRFEVTRQRSSQSKRLTIGFCTFYSSANKSLKLHQKPSFLPQM